jgi:Bacterial SH3 domain/WD40-like Beta Propeller Repeat
MITRKQFAALLCVVAALALGTFAIAGAQAAEPTAIIDAALRDLSQKLGKPLTRQNVDAWTWEQLDFPDASLGCPQPGQTYAQTITRGYKIIFTVGGVVYDYRALNDGSRVFQCTSSGTSPVAATPTPEVGLQPRVVPIPVGQPLTYQRPLAYVRQDGSVYITSIGQGPGVPIVGDATIQIVRTPPFINETRHYGQFAWSPDGTKLLFTDAATQSLYLAISGQKPVQIARGLATLYPGAWSPDGSEIAYAVETRQPQGDGLVRQVQAVPVTSNGVGQPRVAGSFVQRVGCGGATIDPAEALYMGETGYGGNPLTLVWTAQGFVYSTSCIGVGLALADSGGQVLWSIPDAARATVSTDRTRAISLRMNEQGQQSGLVSIDLSNGVATPLQSEPFPDQMALTPDGSTLIYSTLSPAQPLHGNPQAAAGQQLFGGSWPIDAPIFQVTLWRMSATGGQSSRLYQSDGRGIGVIAPAPDNAGVAFSVVMSLVPMIQQINNGASADQALAALPRTDLLHVNWNGDGQAVTITPAGRPAFGSGTFTAVPVEVQSASVPPAVQPSSNVPPPDLVIGGQAVVSTTKGDTLNMRQSPSRSAPVLRVLKPGAVVKVLAGPQSAEGFRWWQVQALDDNSVGWVVDQVTDQDGTTNTLTPQ